jgi:two-component system, NarL family, sensor kinase
VVRHAHAQHCAIRLALSSSSPKLIVEIEDDGRGLGNDKTTGIGLHSMRERAEELGGTWSIRERPGGGTQVRAELSFSLFREYRDRRQRATPQRAMA